MAPCQTLAFRLVPYHARSCSSIPVTCLVDHNDLAHVITDKDATGANSEDI